MVDLNAGKVLKIDDLPINNDFTAKEGEIPKIPTATNNYDPDLLPETFLRKDLKPLEVQQPEGASFTVDGNQISWQKFKIRIGLGNENELSKIIFYVKF